MIIKDVVHSGDQINILHQNHIYVNGQLDQSFLLGVNPFPDFIPSTHQDGLLVTQSVLYRYPDYVLTGSTAIDVNAGDFVEVYLYAYILGQITEYTPPDGFTIASAYGVGSATVNIKSASIITSQ